MKKYITIAALLAAGTAFSNAAVETWSELAGTKELSASGDSVQSWDVSDSGLTWTGGTLESVIFTIETSSINSSNSYALMSIKDGTYNGLAGIAITGGNLTFVNWTNTSAPKTASVAWSTLSESDDLTFVLSRGSSDAMSLTVYADGNFDTATATLTGQSNFKFSSAQDKPTEWKKLNFGGTTEGSYLGNVNNVMPANSNAAAYTLLGAGYTVGDVADEADLKGYYAATVPEPSAFGLLAGLGALALVASRRRRK